MLRNVLSRIVFPLCAAFVLLTACAFPQASSGAKNGTARPAATPGESPKLGKYVCYDLVLRTGMTFGRMEYRYEYMDSFTLLPGGKYQRDVTKTVGRYAFDAKTRVVTFLDGPYAEVGRHGEFTPARENTKKPENAKGVGVDNIVLTKESDETRDSDWFCSCEETK
jgi:hypothetical protein